MAVIMVAEVPGVGTGLMDEMRAAGVTDALQKSPGFVRHISGAASTGYRVIEVWESREAHQNWYDTHVAPNLPPGIGPITTEYIDLSLALPESTT